MAGALGGLRWAVVVTSPNRENAVCERLDLLPIEHRLFKLRLRMARRGRLVDIIRPAFPGYVMVVLSGAIDLIHGIAGVIDFVRTGEQIAEVPPAEVEALERISGPSLILPWETPSKFRHGDTVRFVSGVEGGLLGRFGGIIRPGRASVYVDMMGREVPIEADEENLELAPKRKTRRSTSSRRKFYESMGLQLRASV